MRILFAIGVLLVAIAAWLALRSHRRILAAKLVDGRVTELIPVRGSKGGTNYKLRIAYRDPAGVARDFVTGFASNPPMHALDEVVKVGCFDPGEPPILVSFPARFGTAWVVFLVGALFLILPLGFWYGPGWMKGRYFPFG